MDWPKNARPETKLHVSFTKRNAARYGKFGVLSLTLPFTNEILSRRMILNVTHILIPTFSQQHYFLRMTVSIAMDWPRNVRQETKMPVSFTKRNVKR